MARLTLGVGTSHGPLLNTPPEQWDLRARADRANPALAYRGGDYTFDELLAARAPGFAAECELPERKRRYDASRAAIDAVGKTLRTADVDVLVVVSSDHKEVFGDEMLPQFAFFWGEQMRHEPFTEADLAAMPPGLALAEVANVPATSTVRRGHPDLALHLIRETSTAGFDPCASRELPAGRYGNHGIPHGWGFVYQQLLGGESDLPVVPLFVNTFWEPNPPSAARCFDFGMALGKAIASFPADLRVGVVASGGLSHFVVDEALDRAFLRALAERDAAYLRGIPNNLLRSGTSELRNWIVVAGALHQRDLAAEVVAYEPCYRSEAGTGCAAAFVTWAPPAVPR
ncbi:DODA-type extradiol aromatic ring-opening family dioxygenase [Micromonospora sp. NPDC004704]